MKDTSFAKYVLLINGLLPLALMGLDAPDQTNPPEFLLHDTGLLAIFFLVLSLTITPVRKISGYNYLSNFRRLLGLLAFFYASLHLMIWFVAYHSFSIGETLRDMLDKRFTLFGAAALLLMVPLAITSTTGSIKRLGAARWKRLHQLVYITAICAAVHFWMSRKVVGGAQLAFAIVIGVLLFYRIVGKYIPMLPRAKPIPVAAHRDPG